MDKRIKMMWIKALTSGKYKKEVGRLHSNEKNTYCCLGVLCDLHSKRANGRKWSNSSTYYNSKSFLPKVVQKWAGLDTNDCTIETEDDFTSLVEANDDLRLTFPQIARLIKKYL